MKSVCKDSHPEFAMVINKTKMHIVHIQCLLRNNGSKMAGVFLTSSFCVVPESSGSSNAASSSLFVHVGLCTRTSLVQLIALSQQLVHGFFQILAYCRRQPQILAVVKLHRSLHCGVNQFRLQLLTVELLL